MRRGFVALVVLVITARARADEPPPAPPPPEFEPPELLQFVSAEYPGEALAAGLEARVTVRVLVDVEGRSTEVTVVTPAGHGFDEAAVAAVEGFVWKPARARGKPVPLRVEYEYVFELPEAPPPPSPGPPGSDLRGESPRPPAPGTLKGEVRQRGSRKPLAAEVAIIPAEKDMAVAELTAAADGTFTVELPPGAYKVVVAATGHRRRTLDETLAAGETVTVRYLLDPLDDDPYQTIVEGERPREEVERRSATVEEATRIAGTRGDALRVVENFPGVARPPLGVGAIVVRGSNPEDTTAYIGGHFVPLIYHFGGVTSIVNADLLARIDFLPGNFSARYGRATGGIVEVELRAPRKDRLGGYVDMSLLDTGFLLEGPVGKGSWALAARRSYVDVVLGAVLPDEVGFVTAPRYWDYQALLDHPLWGGRLSLSALGSDDAFAIVLSNPADFDPSFRGELGAKTHIQRVNATWRRRLSDRTRLYASVAEGFTALDFGFGEFVQAHFEQYLLSYRFEAIHRPFSNVKVTMGTEGQFYPFHVDVFGPRPPMEGDIPGPSTTMERLEQDRDGFEWRHGFYMEADFDLGRGVTLTPGTRLDYYRLNHAWAADPRLAARWDIDAHNALRGGIGSYSEPPLEFMSDPVFGNPDIRPEHSIHASLGYDRKLPRGLSVETTLFYKWMYDLSIRDEETLEFNPDGTVSSIGYANLGGGRVYGSELLLRYARSKSTFGWLSYTLSRSERQDVPGGEYRLFSLDQTHIFTLIANFVLPWRMQAGVRFRYVTGNPQTPIVGSLYDADSDVYAPIPGELNSERVDDYLQLDARIEKRFVFDSWMMTAYVDVGNVTNRANPEGYLYSYDYRDRGIVSGLPIFPSFGIKGEF